MLLHEPVIACDARLAFRSVRNDPSDFLRFLRHHLDKGREACTAETDDACIFDLFDDFLC